MSTINGFLCLLGVSRAGCLFIDAYNLREVSDNWRRSNKLLDCDTKTCYICIIKILHQDAKTKYMFVNRTLCHIT